MSAYVVNQNHISAIVRWACRNNVSVYYSNPTRSLKAGQEQEMAEILLAENVKSVNYRYNETAEPEAIVYDAFATILKPVEVIKACQCLEYQSCEHDGWDDSVAKKILDTITDAAIRNLPGYDAAPWEIRAKVGVAA